MAFNILICLGRESNTGLPSCYGACGQLLARLVTDNRAFPEALDPAERADFFALPKKWLLIFPGK